ncbi:MAG: LysR family transcriptional regulator [Desulfomonile tiedjei]|uniref:LysR family transcriptional regulator n=1 Tax=Desulfomonile tiedjei TaxID=2358 RepID=A0A9D6V6F3_9BACT|nr:LysR family transcriptional regulator [Desulfomonile tiedjei]
MMNLNHLETFHYFCKFLSMSRTADQLHVSQPAVSQQLRIFQTECGVQLFYRDCQTYKLTETGEALFLISKRVFARVEQMEELLEKARLTTADTLRIGSTKAYARIVMPELISRFKEKYPKIRVCLSEGNSADLINRVRVGKEDLVVVARTDYGSELHSCPFGRAEFVLVARPDHPLAKKGTVSIKCLNGEPMIMREQGSGSRNAILKRLGRHGVTPSVLMESESLSFILAYMKRQNSVSFLLSHEIKDELARGILKQISLEEGTIVFDSDIVLRRNENISVPTGYFLEILKKYGESNL